MVKYRVATRKVKGENGCKSLLFNVLRRELTVPIFFGNVKLQRIFDFVEEDHDRYAGPGGNLVAEKVNQPAVGRGR